MEKYITIKNFGRSCSLISSEQEVIVKLSLTCMKNLMRILLTCWMACFHLCFLTLETIVSLLLEMRLVLLPFTLAGVLMDQYGLLRR